MLKIYFTLPTATFEETVKVTDFPKGSFAFYLHKSQYIERVSETI